jgi:large subunit ribosomal protein L24
MAGMRLRKGDEVMVIAGKDRGKRGRVQEVRPRDLTVIVAGLNIAKHHTKANPAKNQKGGIIEQPMPLGLGKVMVICPHCGERTEVFDHGGGQRCPHTFIRPRPELGS